MPLKYPGVAALCLALSIETIVSLNRPSNFALAGDRSQPTTDIHNPMLAQTNVNSGTSARENIENTRWHQFNPPNDIGTPGRREGGGTRGPSLTALVPQTLMGLTLSARPTFYYHVSAPLQNSTVEFELVDEEDNTIYKTTFKMSTPSGGIFSIPIPEIETSPILEVGKTYRSSLTVKMSDGGFLNLVTGWVKRVELSPTAIGELDRANPQERLEIYSREAIWFDALASLAELRRSAPEDPQLELRWNQLLKEVKLDPIAQQPLLKSQFVSE